ncbi:MAG: HAD-IIB family hydrolase [Acidobacteriota bacterium]
MMRGKGIIIYTDLDGTLLDHETYSFAESLPAIRAAQSRGIPIVFCSSKTRGELELLRQQLQVNDPFIVENGGAAIIPAHHFPFFSSRCPARGDPTIALGTSYQSLVEALNELRAAFPDQIIGFSDMTAEEVAFDCGLPLDEARLAKRREFDEPFRVVNADTETVCRLKDAIRQFGLSCSEGGRYYHLHGNNDKGLAIRILNRLFWAIETEIFTVGLGDGLNDLPMLAAVDYPVLVKRADGSHHQTVIEHLPQIHLTDSAGPRGWSEAVMNILKQGVSKNEKKGRRIDG